MNNLITIDGPSGAGKTTVALLVARRTGLTYVPSGKLFRAAAYVFSQATIDLTDAAAVSRLASTLTFTMDEAGRIYFGDDDLTDKLGAPEIGLLSSRLAQHQALRQQLRTIQRAIGLGKGCVIEGRSTAIEIFPEADLKIWLTADTETRKQRKAQAEGQQAAVDISNRDKMDKKRQLAPMEKAENAVEIDTTNKSANQVADLIVDRYTAQGGKLPA